MGKISSKTKQFKVGKSIPKSTKNLFGNGIKKVKFDDREYVWKNDMEKVTLIREGIPFGAIELVSERLDEPIKSVLSIMGIPQTTYNKKKKENALLDSLNSELILLILELIDFGNEVFNNETEKFLGWLKKPNLSLGGISPDSLLDTHTGISEVKSCLHRIEYGIFA